MAKTMTKAEGGYDHRLGQVTPGIAGVPPATYVKKSGRDARAPRMDSQWFGRKDDQDLEGQNASVLNQIYVPTCASAVAHQTAQSGNSAHPMPASSKRLRKKSTAVGPQKH